jgi:hypothetical protein
MKQMKKRERQFKRTIGKNAPLRYHGSTCASRKSQFRLLTIAALVQCCLTALSQHQENQNEHNEQ